MTTMATINRVMRIIVIYVDAVDKLVDEDWFEGDLEVPVLFNSATI